MSGARLKSALSMVSSDQVYVIQEALSLLKTFPPAKFDESVDIHVCLGIDPRQSDQNVRGGCELPNGLGKSVKVAVFASGEAAQAATDAGADYVGMEDLAESFAKGDINVDTVIASPDSMKVVGKLGPVLGPRGLMPNPKDGTVSKDVAAATLSAKAGKVRFRNDKGGIIHTSVGRVSFAVDQLQQNIQTLVAALVKLKPASAKGKFLKRCYISTTMGPGIEIDIDSVS